MKIFFTKMLTLILCTACSDNINSQFNDSAITVAAKYFKEAKAATSLDNGRLWGKELYGPILFIDKKTGTAYSNEKDSAGTFVKSGTIYVGIPPKSFGANTAHRWGGKVWTVVLWPLPKEKNERISIITHELFHQFQLLNGLTLYSPVCSHLDKYEARLLLKLELEALRKVIQEYPKFSNQDLVNAIAMRKLRYQKYPEADSLEHALEFNEGLATYTGFTFVNENLERTKTIVSKKIDEFYTNQTFVRSLGYITGYTYGFLLHQKNKSWTQDIISIIHSGAAQNFYQMKAAASFEDITLRLYNLTIKNPLTEIYSEIVNRSKYTYNKIFAFEKKREDKRLAEESENRKKFVDGPVLELPNEKMSFNFNPNEVQVLEGFGPVYPTFSAKADWGSLDVTKGGIMIKNWMLAYLPLPESFNAGQRVIKTDNWQLNLNEGWVIKEGKRKGDYRVAKE